MSTESVEAPVATRRQTLRFYGAWVLVAGCLLLLGTIVVAGERTTSYDDLSSAVAAGRVDEVHVVGGIHEGGSSAFVEVHWRSGPIGRVTEVVETTSRGAVADTALDAPVIDGLVDDRLTELDPSLRITRGGDLHGYSELKSWRIPSWTGLVGVAVGLCVLVLLVLGPQPWRATRWAWFWLLGLAPPLGLLAFLLLGGATRLWPPARPEVRLTGGWAFLLAIVVGAAQSAVGAAFL